MLSLVLILLGAVAAPAAAPPIVASAKGVPDDVYGLNKVWSMHLNIGAKEWETMFPTRGGFGKGKEPAPLNDDRKLRGGFNFDFEYVKGDINIDGALLKDIGIRFKGNSSFSNQPGLKKPFRIDFDRYVDGQTFKGVGKISLNNLVMDPSAAREVLGFALYRQAGVPAPRTAFAELYLTVPGKYQREFLGLYVFIEGIDKQFFKSHFKSGGGVAFKPERVGALDYLGEDWSVYQSRYRPRPEKLDEHSQRRLIDFAWLVQGSNDKVFREQIDQFLDIDNFLRYLACTVLLSSMDSFVGLGHNYYLYLDPKTKKFTCIPWDLDHSYGGLNFLGTATTLSELSIAAPHLGKNRLVDRLLADEKHLEAYKAHLRTLIKTVYTADGTRRDLEVVTKLTTEIRAREKQAVAKRKEPQPGGGIIGSLFTASPDLTWFVQRRVASVEAQLAGKSEGRQVNWGIGANQPAWLQLSKPILAAADKDADGKFTREEFATAARTLFTACADGKDEIDEKTLRAGLLKLLPRPHNRPGSRDLPAVLAKRLMDRGGKDGKLNADGLVVAAEKAFASLRTELVSNGKADERAIAESLRLMTSPGQLPSTDKKKEDRK